MEDVTLQNLLKNFASRNNYRRSPSHVSLIPLALTLSACGGGGGSSTIAPTQTVPTQGTNNQTATPQQQLLTLSQVGDEYQSTSVSGFSLVDKQSKYLVANDVVDNSYDVIMKASGVGMLEFEFEDANDVVTLQPSSSITGFSQLKVLHGSVDFSDANLGSVNYISVASSAEFSFSQAQQLEAIVSNSQTGKISFKVSSLEEAAQIKELITSGKIKAYGETQFVDLEAEDTSNLDPTSLTAEMETLNSNVRPLSENQFVEISAGTDTIVTATGAVLLAVGGGGVSAGASNNFLNGDADVLNVSTRDLGAGKYLIEIFLDNVFPDYMTGLPAFDFRFSLDTTEVSYVSQTSEIGGNPYFGQFNAINANQGDFRVTGIYLNGTQNGQKYSKFNAASEALLSFQVTDIGDANSLGNIEFTNADYGGNIVNLAAYSLET